MPFLGSFVALMLAEGGATGFERFDHAEFGRAEVEILAPMS